MLCTIGATQTSEMLDKEYWRKVILVAKNTTLKRANRCLTVMGRKEGEMKEVAQYFYPMMQCADIFQLKADITQLGLDQRKVNMLAREVAPKLGYVPPICLHNPLLPGLQITSVDGSFDEDAAIDKSIRHKMSKSIGKGALWINDSPEDIKEKYREAYCPEKIVIDNPVLDHARMLVFPYFKQLDIERQKNTVET